jgi:hypothetical protein
MWKRAEVDAPEAARVATGVRCRNERFGAGTSAGGLGVGLGVAAQVEATQLQLRTAPLWSQVEARACRS